MTVSTVDTQQFFKLVPGQQFTDCFSDCSGPFTNRAPWTVLLKDEGEEWYVTNGVFRVSASYAPDPYPLGLILPRGTNMLVRDFHASVDILSWETSTTNTGGTNRALFALAGRGTYYPDTGGATGYIAGLIVNSDNIPGRVSFMMWDSAIEVRGPYFDMGTYPPPYRLEFSVVGKILWVRVLSLTTGELIRERKITSNNCTEGWVGLYTNRRNNPGNTFTLIADNFFMTGTK